MIRFVAIVAAAFLAAIIAAQLAYQLNPNSHGQSGNQAWAQNRMEFVAWNEEKWTAWIRGDNFEQAPLNTSKWSRHAKPSLAFIDWNGETWQAKIEDSVFLLAYRGDWNGTIERSSSIRYRDWNGNNQLRTVAQLRR
ncbi:MAG: hypothetical protein R3284_09875 [Rubricoccaceae bacterium]|nr:hypothetical protein [Rubricoccaceae bacterium]